MVKTDNNPLTYLLSSAKLDRWLAALAGFLLNLKYGMGLGIKMQSPYPIGPTNGWKSQKTGPM